MMMSSLKETDFAIFEVFSLLTDCAFEEEAKAERRIVMMKVEDDS